MVISLETKVSLNYRAGVVKNKQQQVPLLFVRQTSKENVYRSTRLKGTCISQGHLAPVRINFLSI